MKHVVRYLFLFVTLPSLAAERSLDQALAAAQTFFQQSPSSVRKVSSSPSLYLAATYHQTNKQIPAFYVFNRGEQDGYVLISADDRTPAVLGYADRGTMDDATMPDNLRAWLAGYQQVISDLPDHISIAEECAQATTDSVLPLLGEIKWNQSAPFNNQCPIYKGVSRASAGCVATATAQVMKYYEHPQRGKGSHSYTSKTQKYELSANFDTIYQWSNIRDTYKNNAYSRAEGAAVALLMSHVGIATDMNYASNGSASSTQTQLAGYALKTYFGYDKSMHFESRDHYAGDWEELIRTELRNKRPVIYSGYNPSSGHSFVCDGFNTKGYFHFNWGWGGTSNGYFLLTVLYPSGQGIGGSGKGYAQGQEAIIGVKPDEGGKEAEIPHFTYNDLQPEETSYGRFDDVVFKASKLQNNSVDEVSTGNLAILIMQDYQIKARIPIASASNLKQGYYYSTKSFKGTISELARGSYDVAMGYWETGYEKWRLVNGKGGVPYYFTLEVTFTTLTFTPREKNSSVPEFCDLLAEKWVAKGKTTLQPVVFIASQYHDFRDTMRLELRDVATETVAYTSDPYYVDIVAGTYDTTSLSISSLPAAGLYHAYLYYQGGVDTLQHLIQIVTPTDLVSTDEQSLPTPHKVIRDGQVLIKANEEWYNLQGEQVK